MSALIRNGCELRSDLGVRTERCTPCLLRTEAGRRCWREYEISHIANADVGEYELDSIFNSFGGASAGWRRDRAVMCRARLKRLRGGGLLSGSDVRWSPEAVRSLLTCELTAQFWLALSRWAMASSTEDEELLFKLRFYRTCPHFGDDIMRWRRRDAWLNRTLDERQASWKARERKALTQRHLAWIREGMPAETRYPTTVHLHLLN